MSKRDPCLFLNDILEAIFRIEEYTEGYEFEDFIRDRKTVDAVLRN
nr:HepT-like ribonuclease domain-containing protein [Thermococcus sp. MV11]